MYIVNDMNYLLYLAKFKMLERLPIGKIVISKFKMHDYGAITKQQIGNYQQIEQVQVDELELFENWRLGRSQQLTDGDLSTIYIAMKSPQVTVLISEEDLFLPEVCNQCGVRYIHWDEVIREIADEKMIELYELIKRAS